MKERKKMMGKEGNTFCSLDFSLLFEKLLTNRSNKLNNKNGL